MSRAVRFDLAASLDEDMDVEPELELESAAEGEDIDQLQDETRKNIPPSTDEGSGDLPRVLSIQIHGGKIGCAFFDVTTGRLSLLEDAPEEGTRVHVHSMGSHDDDGIEEGEDGMPLGVTAEDRENDSKDGAVETAKETLMTLLEQFAPVNLVLTSSDSSARFHAVIRKELVYQDSVLSIRPSTEFSTYSGSQRITSLTLQQQGTNEEAGTDDASDSPHASARTTTSFGSKLQSCCAIDLHAMPLSVGAAGALLSHLTRIQASIDPSEGTSATEGASSSAGNPCSSSTLRISSIDGIVLQNCLSISAESRIALDVFGEESHAALHSSSRKHEGLSLFGILDTTRTPISHALLRRWLLLPTTQLDVINSRQAAVATFASPSNVTAVRSIERELKGVKNIPKMLGKLMNGTAKLPDWKAILKFCYHVLVIRESMLDFALSEPVDLVQKVKTLCDKRILNFCSQHIAGIIDFDESITESRICIRSGYDEELDRWKQLYAGLPDLLNKFATDVRPDVNPSYQEISVCYFPQLGYLLAIPKTEDMQEEVPMLEGWDFQFASENALYFKGEKMRDLDVHLGDIQTLIVEREIEHLYALQQAVCQHAPALLQMADLLAELDCLLALADAAARFAWVRPEVTDEVVIEIFQGRHALQELTVDSFVPNDAYLCGRASPSSDLNSSQEQVDEDQKEHGKSLLVITGANGSGKSVYLKQIGLIVLLAHIGSFIPAQGARIGLCDQILTSIQARHSVSRLQSSFLLDVSQVGFALRQCTARSLVLFDEIGKGTDAIDGAALFAATIRQLLERHGGCPRTLVATHFHEAFHPAMLPQTLHFQTAHMEVMLSETMTSENSTSAPSDDIVFLFRLAPGLALTSNAAHLARVFLVPEHIVQRAEHVAELARSHDLAALLLEEDDSGGEEAQTQAAGSSTRHGTSEASKAVKARQREEREKVIAAEERVRAFLEWDLDAELVEDEEDAAPMSVGTTSGEGQLDTIRQRLADIMNGKGVQEELSQNSQQ
ncbi:hypothetical protein OC835_002362 [Tilletia horrida]|nr:hypothetical protein OC835_002362 [Tilletia horrida]